ncbi:MAG TPA: hypothetical protein VMH22_02295, partial [bacterium]|nr:hypothetical protein [bacterium]
MNPRASRDLRAGLVVVGFLVLLAFSPAPACLRKPPKEETVKVTLRALPQGDTLSSKYGLSEVIATPLGRVLPGVRFYQGIERIKCYGAEYPYLIAIVGGKRYSMPGGFDWLLFDKG